MTLRLATLLVGAMVFPARGVLAGPYVNIDSFSYSAPIAIHGVFNEWEGDFDGGDVVLTANKAVIGFEYPNWRIFHLTRLDYHAAMSRETAEFVYLTENHKPLADGRTYDLDLSVHHMYARGLGLEYRHQVKRGLTLSGAVTYLEGVRLMSGGLRGKATALGDDKFEFEANVDYAYSRDALFGRENDEPSGRGFTFDFGIDWQAYPSLHVLLAMSDLNGWVDWRRAPYTTAVGSSDNKAVDEDGYQLVKPIASGIEGYRDYHQALPTRTKLRLDYLAYDGFSLYTEALDFEGLATFLRAGMVFQVHEGRAVSIGTDVEHGGLLFEYHSGNFRASLQVDDTAIDEMNTLGFSVSWKRGY
jgi:hypothetical protein